MADTSIGVRVLKDHILVNIYDTGERVVNLGGKDFILLGDDMLQSVHNVTDQKHPGIRPRWAVVLSASDAAEKAGIKVGDKVLLDQLKWTRSVFYNKERDKCWRIHVNDVLLIDEDGLDENEQKLIESKKRQ